MASAKGQPRTISTILNEVIERVNSDTQRLRILEQSSESILSRMNAIEQGALMTRREAQKEMDDLSLTLNKIDDRLSKMESTMKEVVNHMKKLVTDTQLRSLEEMVNIYNPVKSSFVTKDELQKILAERGEKPQKTKTKPPD